MKKIIAAICLAIMGVLVAPAIASAHTAEAYDYCEGLTVKAFIYPSDVHVVITIDGVVKRDALGGGQWDYTWDQTKDHSWTAVIDSPDGENGTQFDHNFSGSQKACQKQETTTTTTQPEETTTTTVPDETTTTVAETTTTVTGTTVLETTTTQPTVTTPEATTTTVVVSPPVEKNTPAPPTQITDKPDLPATGPTWNAPGLILCGVILILLGTFLILKVSRRKPVS